MAKKPSKQIVKTTFSDVEIQSALEITHSEYFMQVIALMSHDPKIEELNYVKVPVTTPDGGTYLISILHIDGPKINVQQLGKAAEASEKEKA